MQSFLFSALLLAAFVAAGVGLIIRIRSWFRPQHGDSDAWETTLAEYKNLRDKGVLSAEEYRKIRSLVERRAESIGDPVAGDQKPTVRRCG